MMKLNLDQVLLDPDGNEMSNLEPKVDASGVPERYPNGAPVLVVTGKLTLSAVLYLTVNAVYEKEGRVEPVELMKRAKLARKVKSGGEKEFSADDIGRMTRLLTLRYPQSPVFLLSVCEILDPENELYKAA